MNWQEAFFVLIGAIVGQGLGYIIGTWLARRRMKGLVK